MDVRGRDVVYAEAVNGTWLATSEDKGIVVRGIFPPLWRTLRSESALWSATSDTESRQSHFETGTD